MSLAIVNTLPEAEWRRFVDAHPDSNIYHTPEMFQVYARARGYRPTLWAAVADGQTLALLLPVEVSVLGGPARLLTTRAIVYGSVLAAPGPAGAAALTELLAAYARRAGGWVLFTELRNLSPLPEAQPVLAAQGFRYENHLNFLVDLQPSEEALWRKVTKSGQQSIRTSRNKGTVIEVVEQRAGLGEAYTLLQAVYARAQVPLAHPSLFEAAFDILGPAGLFKAFVARAEGRAIGACLALAWRERVIDWYAGTDRGFAAHAPMEALIWHVITWARANGYTIFDFGGAGRPEEDYGPRKFKAKFGGELVELGRNVHVPSPLRLRASEFGYRLLRRFL
ncbi:MAG: GNAT family N-acetyltransferase [Anaerolineales bacterium]|nr:GNAT family N-acetyltransferase [Anaerolineales bacterium]